MKKVEKSRIEELAEQCENWYEVEDGMLDLDFQYEKFARLIIQECIDVMMTEIKNTSLLMSNPPQSSAIWDARNKIRKHFGVE